MPNIQGIITYDWLGLPCPEQKLPCCTRNITELRIQFAYCLLSPLTSNPKPSQQWQPHFCPSFVPSLAPFPFEYHLTGRFYRVDPPENYLPSHSAEEEEMEGELPVDLLPSQLEEVEAVVPMARTAPTA